MNTLQKTNAELLAIMDVEQARIPALAGAKSSSATSVLTYLKKMFATLWQLIATEVDDALATIAVVSAQYQVGTLQWYVDQAKKFQYGYPTLVIDGRVGYATDVPTSRIVTQAAAVEDAATARLQIKVVKSDATGLVPLSTDELSAFRAYVAQVKWAGTAVDVVSLAADELKLTVRVKIDPKVLSANGASLANPTTRPIPAAIQAYLRQLPFNGELTWNGLTDYMQAIPGVVTFDVLKSSNRDAGAQNWTEFTAQYDTRAGHMALIVAESEFKYV